MKQYTVYFSKPVAHTYKEERFDKETREWEEVEVKDMVKSVTFHSLAPAKKLIKSNLDKYAGSCITKIWADGSWEDLGEISLKGSNKNFVANTKQKVANY